MAPRHLPECFCIKRTVKPVNNHHNATDVDQQSCFDDVLTGLAKRSHRLVKVGGPIDWQLLISYTLFIEKPLQSRCESQKNTPVIHRSEERRVGKECRV